MASNPWGPLGDVFRGFSVYSGPSTSPSNYSYYYDGFNRRRLKVYPTNVQDEYFYGAGKELLEDRGAYSLSAASPYPMDEYIWLDGRPVAFIRSKHTLNGDAWVREPGWGSGSCQRNGEPMACGAYFIVTDHIGKPVLVLDSNRKVAGVADYDPFGFPNRRFLQGETAHPYANNASQVLASLSQPQTSGMQMDARVLFQAVDTEGIGWDYAYLATSSGMELGSHVGGWHKGRQASDWVSVPSDGGVDVGFRSDSSNYCIDTSTSNISCPTGACSYCPPGAPSCSCPSFPYWGVALEAYEYRRYQAGAVPAWTPLRFPGQYFDAETDLFENWNRYYDPSIGRYLQPEPLMQDSHAVAASAQHGRIPQSYAYSLDNPVGFLDSDGLDPTGVECNQTDSTVSCCLKQHPGEYERCGGEAPVEPKKPPPVPPVWVPPGTDPAKEKQECKGTYVCETKCYRAPAKNTSIRQGPPELGIGQGKTRVEACDAAVNDAQETITSKYGPGWVTHHCRPCTCTN